MIEPETIQKYIDKMCNLSDDILDYAEVYITSTPEDQQDPLILLNTLTTNLIEELEDIGVMFTSKSDIYEHEDRLNILVTLYGILNENGLDILLENPETMLFIEECVEDCQDYGDLPNGFVYELVEYLCKLNPLSSDIKQLFDYIDYIYSEDIILANYLLASRLDPKDITPALSDIPRKLVKHVEDAQIRITRLLLELPDIALFGKDFPLDVKRSIGQYHSDYLNKDNYGDIMVYLDHGSSKANKVSIDWITKHKRSHKHHTEYYTVRDLHNISLSDLFMVFATLFKKGRSIVSIKTMAMDILKQFEKAPLQLELLDAVLYAGTKLYGEVVT